jgi:hypothetical protein
MIDENAFGLLVSYCQIEDEEYGLELEQFAARVRAFRASLDECLAALPLGHDVRALDLGHALYVEVGEGDETENPIDWLRMVRARLAGRGFQTVGVLSHGSRWVDRSSAERAGLLEQLGDVSVCRAGLPSEPLRRALYADAACVFGQQEHPGWGPGLYVDTEAIEALGRKLKNAPTPLVASGATFYRFGK